MKRKRKSEDVHEVKHLKDANGESVKSKGEEEDEGPPPESDFKKYRISKVSRKTLKSRGITHLFPIQYKTFDPIYDKKDVMGQARKIPYRPVGAKYSPVGAKYIHRILSIFIVIP
uniref:Uncharacterized protein n=1 Tax=Amphimedon queenslandica TaxID=400682 RepID=A0A1X7SLD8_AMPQE